MQNLPLKRALVGFDLETTGVKVASDRIVEVSSLKIQPDGRESKQTQLVNPNSLHAPKAIYIHGITEVDVKDKTTFLGITRTMVQDLTRSGFVGYNYN